MNELNFDAFSESDLANALLIVAHPDDECLWFSSVLEAIGTIVIAYGDVPGEPQWSAGRAALGERYPYPDTEFLNLTEAVSVFGADWSAPEATPYGLKVRSSKATLPGFDANRYEENYARLQARLEPLINKAERVFTHNPWGEYGHEDHVQLSKVVTELADERNIPVWYSNYVSDRSFRLMATTMLRRQVQQTHRPTNIPAYERLEALYRDLDCWTWSVSDYQLPKNDGFFRIVDSAVAHGLSLATAMDLNYLPVDSARQFREQPGVARRWVRACVRQLRGQRATE